MWTVLILLLHSLSMLVTKDIYGNETSENTDQFWDHRSDFLNLILI